MTKHLLLAAVAAASLAVPGSAKAAILMYELTSAPGFSGGWTFSFQLDTSRTPSFRTNDAIRYAPTTVSYTLPGSTIVRTETASNVGPTFFAPINQGGLSILRLNNNVDPQPRFFGPALFTGPTSSPTFLTGTFDLSDRPRNVPSDVQPFNYRLTVRDVGAVPEPGTWAMMLVGFGAVGFAMRRRGRPQLTLPAMG